MIDGPVLMDIEKALILALRPIMSCPVETVQEATGNAHSPLVIVMPPSISARIGRIGLGSWSHTVSFRIVGSSLSEAMSLSDLFYRAVHSLPEDSVSAEGVFFGKVTDVVPPKKIASSQLGGKLLTDYLATFEFVVST